MFLPVFRRLVGMLSLLGVVTAVWGVPKPTIAKVASEGAALGLSIGSPTGLDGKFGLGGDHSLNATIGVHFLPHDAIGIGVEYNYRIYKFTVGSTTDELYLGAGGMLTLFNYGIYGHHKHVEGVGAGFIARIPFGVEFNFNKVPINLFLELAPGLGVVSGKGFDFLVDVAAGFRFIF
ncbi:MAG: hypothetical protein HUU55_21100 [Myxococcales bacterium]|nr:hypothetical protein [Myxococcales bacterium]